MAREPIPTHAFAFVIVRRDDGRFLVVRERKHDQRWYLPAGRVERGETLEEAARREALEESGVAVTLTGVLRVEQEPLPTGQRLRVFFLGRPTDPDAVPKSEPDEHSLEARWVTIEELGRLPLRAYEALDWCAAVAGGMTAAPMSLLTREGARPGLGRG